MNSGIFLLLGTNLGNRIENLSTAKTSIHKEIGKIIKVSSLYKTSPWGNPDQPDFYNQVIEIETDFDPDQLLAKLLEVEKQLGRMRKEKWGPRIIDIDILFFDQLILKTPTLILPHPAIQDRKFTLIPLAEIAPEYLHPVLKKDIRTLLKECTDVLPVERVL